MRHGIILHIPHSTTEIPLKEGFVLDDAALRQEMALLTDWFTDELFDLPFPKAVAPFSRIFCDVERFADDESEIMSRVGMGMCYTHTYDGRLMRKVTPDLRKAIERYYYRKHHDELERLTAQALSKSGRVIILDCHSFPDQPMMRDLNQDLPRPDFCIGTDDFHTPAALPLQAVRFLQNLGYAVKVNTPYSGSMVPMAYFQKTRKVMSLMIEISRKLYMRVEENEAVKTGN